MLLFFCCDQTPEKENKETVMNVGSWHNMEGQTFVMMVAEATVYAGKRVRLLPMSQPTRNSGQDVGQRC